MTDTTTLVLKVDSSDIQRATAELDKLAAAGAKVENVTAMAQQAWRQQTIHANAAAQAAKLHAHQMQQLSFQLHDFAVQVFSGQNPFVALVQQGSQISGTFGGVGNTFRALGGVVTTTGVAISGLAGAIAVLGFAAYEGYERTAKLNKAIELSGNFAGITAGEFREMYRAIGDATNTGARSARDTLEALVSSGRFAGDALQATAQAAQFFAEVSDRSAEDIVQGFVAMTNGVARWAESANRSYHFLTAAQLEYIQTLEDQGNQQKAIEVTMNALTDRIDDAAKSVTWLGRQWRDAKKAVSDYMDQLTHLYDRALNGPNVDELLVQAREKLSNLRTAQSPQADLFDRAMVYMRGGEEFIFGQVADQERLVKSLEATKRLNDDIANSSARQNAMQQARIQWNKLQEQSLTKQQKLAKELATANALADRAGMSEAQRADVLKSIKDKYTDKGGIAQALALGKASMDASIKGIKSELAGLANDYRNSEAVMEAARAAGLIDEKAYFDAKRSFIQLNSEAQVRALEQENAQLQAQKASAKDRIVNLAQIAENEAKIAAIKADATGKTVVLDIQQQDALTKVQRAYKEATASAQEYLDMVARQQGRELGTFGMGSRARERADALSQIEERYQTQREQLASELRSKEVTPERQQQYDQQLEIINAFQGKAISQWEAYYQRRTAMEGDWSNGAREAIANYLDANKNAAKLAADAWGGAIGGMEDLLTDFFTTGKADWGKYIQSVIAEIIRLQVVKPILSNVFGSIAPSGGSGSGSSGGVSIFSAIGSLFGGKFADGGSPPVGKVSLVGERGPELFIPKTPGTIVPNHKLGSTAPNVTLNMKFGSDVSPATLAAWGQQIRETVKGEILYSKNAGGMYS
jgi:lambda family phage tail tape measure protein